MKIKNHILELQTVDSTASELDETSFSSTLCVERRFLGEFSSFRAAFCGLLFDDDEPSDSLRFFPLFATGELLLLELLCKFRNILGH